MNIDELRSIVAEVLDVNPVLLTEEAKFEEITDYDSLMVISLMIALDENGVPINQSDVDLIKTFGDIIGYARDKLQILED